MKSLKTNFKKLELKKTAICNLSLQKEQMAFINGGLPAAFMPLENTSRHINIQASAWDITTGISIDDRQSTCTGRTNG